MCAHVYKERKGKRGGGRWGGGGDWEREFACVCEAITGDMAIHRACARTNIPVCTHKHVYPYTRMHTIAYAQVPAHTNAHMHVHTHAHAYAYAYAYAHAHAHAHSHAHVHAHAHEHVHVHMHASALSHTDAYVHAYAHQNVNNVVKNALNVQNVSMIKKKSYNLT